MNKCSLSYHDLKVFQEGGATTREGALFRKNTVNCVRGNKNVDGSVIISHQSKPKSIAAIVWKAPKS